MAKAKPRSGKIRLVVEEKLSGVFGDYSSLGVTLGLEFDGDVDAFESEVDLFTSRLVAKIKTLGNEIATMSGVPLPWALGQDAPNK